MIKTTAAIPRWERLEVVDGVTRDGGRPVFQIAVDRDARERRRVGGRVACCGTPPVRPVTAEHQIAAIRRISQVVEYVIESLVLQTPGRIGLAMVQDVKGTSLAFMLTREGAAAGRGRVSRVVRFDIEPLPCSPQNLLHLRLFRVVDIDEC